LEIYSKDLVGGWTLSLMAKNEEEKKFLLELEEKVNITIRTKLNQELQKIK
jgi:hypothetical protein